MNRSSAQNGPIVIGGVGGSGTRVVTEILSKLGFYVGHDLNKASDNLLYTLLFKRPNWFYKNYQNRKEIDIGISLFYKLMFRSASLSLPEIWFLLRAFGSMAIFGHNKRGTSKGLWAAIRILRLLFVKKNGDPQYIGWGWKEPNSYLLIENLAEHFAGFKYIHTIRHGLDMAFSKNHKQVYNWGPFFGVQSPTSRSEIPVASLKFWLKANEKVFSAGKELGDDRFLVIDFDKLCLSPRFEIDKLVSFLGVKIDKNLYEEAIRLPKTPSSKGRYKSHDLSQFDKDDLKMVSEFGFSVK